MHKSRQHIDLNALPKDGGQFAYKLTALDRYNAENFCFNIDGSSNVEQVVPEQRDQNSDHDNLSEVVTTESFNFENYDFSDLSDVHHLARRQVVG